MRPKGVIDGKQANIPVLKVARDGGTQQDRSAGRRMSRFKVVVGLLR